MGLLKMIFGGGDKTEKVQELMNNGAIVIDVRTKGEFQEGHVRGSKNIPLNTVEGKIEKIKKMGKPIVLCCASGGRSGQATRLLKSADIECENGGSWTQVRALARKEKA